MSASQGPANAPARASLLMALLMLTVVISPALNHYSLSESNEVLPTSTGDPWDPYEQPWSQYGHTPTHNFSMPTHSPDGGPGEGNVSDVTELASLVDPVVNWQVYSGEEDGSDAYGSVLGDFSQSITATDAAQERCGVGTLSPVIVSSTISGGVRESFLNIISGNDAKIAWKTSLGTTEAIRSTPIINDIDGDGFQEIIVVYDTSGALSIDVWSPRLTCTESNWQTSGHSNELLWSYSDSDVRIGSPSPHFATSNSDHKAVTQPLLADLQLDGTPELILAVVDDPENNPVVKVQAYTLTASQPSEAVWSVTLDRGTHPSDPVWAQLDDSTTSVLLTTIDDTSGNMWIWQIDGETGSLDWERVAVQGTDSDSDAPRLRLPGPVITQLDTDDAPEMILTVPTDANGRTSGSGARFIGMEITSTEELFNFRAQNGYADAQPLALDTDEDDVADRLCWVTWYSESTISFNRKGMVGCTDISDENPVLEWTRDLQRGSGNDNDEIGVSPPISMNIDDEGMDEIVVAFGRRLWAFDGDTGASADINEAWSTSLTMPHRTWAAPAAADVDGDGHIDLLYGDTLVSQRAPDFAPSADNRGISFTPAQADPGDTVTVTGQFSNIGTGEADDDLDAALYQNGVELERVRFTNSEPVSPSGEGGPLTFTAQFVAELGVHEFVLVLDINGNISEHREDNNIETMTYTVVEPYVARIDGPLTTPRINPGASQTIEIELTSIGSQTASWTLDYDTSSLPNGWTFSPTNGQNLNPELIPDQPYTVSFAAVLPSTALGDESGYVDLTLLLDSDSTINSTYRLPVEVFRTRGLDLAGPSGVNETMGQGRPNTVAKAWFMVENLGNAPETTTSLQWTAPSWGGSPSLHDANGNELFSITLQPGESRELFAHLNTPTSATWGSQTQTTLTLCLGSGEDSLCESLEVGFTAVKISANPSHHRSLPDATLSWQLEGNIPDSGMVQWNMAQAQMLQSEWQWSASGDWSINGTFLEATGTSGDAIGGLLTLYLPPNAEPQRHSFIESDDVDNLLEINITLQVLQVFRSNVSILEPLPFEEGGVLSLNVTEEHMFLLYLENPGNGQDTFRLTAEAKIHQESLTPEVNFTYFGDDDNHYESTLGARSTGIGRVDVSLSQEIPAQVPFVLEFSWTSLGGEEVVHSTSVLIQAAPSREWSVTNSGPENLSVSPGDEIVINLSGVNHGNAPDALTLEPLLFVQHVDSDNTAWSAYPSTSPIVEINQSTNGSVTVHVPDEAWQGTEATVMIAHISNGYTLGHSNVTLSVQQTSGWKLNLTDAQLEIDPAGQNMTLKLEHLGNGFEVPYFSKATAGWNITLPDNHSVVSPYATDTLVVFVQPPSDAVAGEVGMISIRISDDDLAGLVIEEVPVRIGAAPNMTVDHRSSWMVSDEGGFPTAWVENNGNDIALLSFSVSGLPEGWTTQQGQQLVLAPNEIKGVPLNLIPDSEWNGQRFLVALLVEHPLLGTTSHDIEIEQANVSFSQSPVIDAYIGVERSVSLYGHGASDWDYTSSLDIQEKQGILSFIQPTTSGEINVEYSNSSIDGTLSLYIVARTYPDASASCVLDVQSMVNLGIEALDGTIGTCELIAGDHDDLRAVLTAITSNGNVLPLDENAWFVSAGGNRSIDITLNNWDPAPGEFVISFAILDQYGRTLTQNEQEVTARESGWNVGISSFSSEGAITVGISRVGYELLDTSLCRLTVEAESGWEIEYIVDVANSDFAPIFIIEDPGVLSKDDKLTATIGCSTPYDSDDNPDDDSKSIYYQPENILTVSSSDVGWIVGIAAVVLALAWFGGLIRPKEQNDEHPTPTTPQPTPSRTTTTTASNDEIQVVEEDDGLSFEMSEPPVVEVAEIDATEEVLPSTIEVFDEPESVDESPSGRLASLRSELDEGDAVEPSEPLEDRMNRFFGN